MEESSKTDAPDGPDSTQQSGLMNRNTSTALNIASLAGALTPTGGLNLPPAIPAQDMLRPLATPPNGNPPVASPSVKPSR
jgi:hypothetical protein